jgi:hypothetical protein
MPPKLLLYTSDLFSAARHHPQLDGTLLTVRSRKDADCLIRASRVIGLGGEVTVHLSAGYLNNRDDVVKSLGENLARSEERDIERHELSSCTLDISEADVARIVPRVISHRLKALNKPEDELLASAVYGAFRAGNSTKNGEGSERNTVKDILVQILSEV